MASRRGAICLGMVIALVFGCGGDGTAPPAPASASGPASCEAMVDHRIAECPGMVPRLFEIEACEQDRLEVAPIGCTEPLANYVGCQTHADIDCESGEAAGCDDEQLALRRCRQLFSQRTSCSRTATRDAFECASMGRFSFSCIDLRTLQPLAPANCQFVSPAASFCCDSFTGDRLDDMLFVDPELGPDELPPDHSHVAFTDPAMCLDFSEAQGWGRCEQSSGCACANCAAELAVCAADYGCLASHLCDRGGSCGPAQDDPFFTGWGDSDPLAACMESHGCAATCN